jgi:16S rRNA (adenine1518-N6/adenine1519-N6)-dimethyltransferase
MDLPKKSLGQHWLRDKTSLEAVVNAANITGEDIVLEIGPGPGTLTKILAEKARQVIAVEFDEALARLLPPTDNLTVINQDILKFDLTQLPAGYKVVANIPYYLTSNLLRILSESSNPPSVMSLLVQKEVAERVAAGPGQTSLLSISVQLYYQPKLHEVIPAKLFIPPPKVDSQIISLTRHPQPLFEDLDTKTFFQIVKAGFAGRRKKLRSSLAAGLRIDKREADKLLEAAGISGDLRAQELSLQDWRRLSLAANNL